MPSPRACCRQMSEADLEVSIGRNLSGQPEPMHAGSCLAVANWSPESSQKSGGLVAVHHTASVASSTEVSTESDSGKSRSEASGFGTALVYALTTNCQLQLPCCFSYDNLGFQENSNAHWCFQGKEEIRRMLRGEISGF